MTTPPAPEANATRGETNGVPLATLVKRLVLLCVLPLALMAAGLAWHSVATGREQCDQEASGLARNFASSIDELPVFYFCLVHLTKRERLAIWCSHPEGKG